MNNICFNLNVYILLLNIKMENKEQAIYIIYPKYFNNYIEEKNIAI